MWAKTKITLYYKCIEFYILVLFLNHSNNKKEFIRKNVFILKINHNGLIGGETSESWFGFDKNLKDFFLISELRSGIRDFHCILCSNSWNMCCCILFCFMWWCHFYYLMEKTAFLWCVRLFFRFWAPVLLYFLSIAHTWSMLTNTPAPRSVITSLSTSSVVCFTPVSVICVLLLLVFLFVFLGVFGVL